MLRILYLIPGNVAAGRLGAAELIRRRQILQQWAGPGVEITVWDSPEGPFAIESDDDEARCIPPLLTLVGKAEQERFDAVIIGCYGDPGLEAARELVSIPVIGPAQASLHQAAMLGEKFSIMTVVEGVVPLIARLVKINDLSQRLASIRVMHTPVLRITEDTERTYRRLFAEAKQAVEQDRADTLILGCMSLAFQETMAARLQAELQVPVLNPAQSALLYAEHVRQLGGA